MIKKRIYLFFIIALLVFSALSFISVRNNVLYQPRVLDKSSTVSVQVIYYNLFNLKVPLKSKVADFYYDEKNNSIRIINNPNSLLCEVKNEKKSFLITINDNQKKYSISLPIIITYDDSDDDGFPDSMELNDEIDRYNFRKWFCTIALTQYYHLDDRWKDRDCSGLIRYCTREALRVHDNKWLAGKKLLYDINIPDVKKYNYPNIPLNGTRLFRITENNSKSDSNLNIKNYSDFAEARYLLSYNYDFISKDIRDASPGDVLFFSNDMDVNWPYHSMIFLGNDIISEKNIGDYVIYHTGSDEGKEGIIKKLRISDLNKHPNKRWHVISSNPYFLGFYRWKLLK